MIPDANLNLSSLSHLSLSHTHFPDSFLPRSPTGWRQQTMLFCLINPSDKIMQLFSLIFFIMIRKSANSLGKFYLRVVTWLVV